MSRLYTFGKAVTYIGMRFLFNIRYQGLENIPTDQGFILASNHRSNADPMLIAHKVKGQLHFMAKIELFRNGLVGAVLRGVNAFPVSRGSGDTSAIDHATDVIGAGGVLAMFPEGSRSKDGKPGRGRSGVALIAGKTQADVLPCAVVYEGKLRFRQKITVRYGRLIPNHQLGVDISSPATVRAGAKKIMDEIVALLDQ